MSIKNKILIIAALALSSATVPILLLNNKEETEVIQTPYTGEYPEDISITKNREWSNLVRYDFIYDVPNGFNSPSIEWFYATGDQETPYDVQPQPSVYGTSNGSGVIFFTQVDFSQVTAVYAVVTYTDNNGDEQKISSNPIHHGSEEDFEISVLQPNISALTDTTVTLNLDVDLNPNGEYGYTEMQGVTVSSNYGTIISNEINIDGNQTVIIEDLNPYTNYSDMVLTFYAADGSTILTTVDVNSFTTDSLGVDEPLINNFSLGTPTTDSIDVSFDVDLNPNIGYEPIDNLNIYTNTGSVDNSIVENGTNTITISGLTPNQQYDDIELSFADSAGNTIQTETLDTITTESLGIDTPEINYSIGNIQQNSVDISLDVNSNPNGSTYEAANNITVSAADAEGNPLTLNTSDISEGAQVITISNLATLQTYSGIKLTFDSSADESVTITLGDFETLAEGTDNLETGNINIVNTNQENIELSFTADVNPNYDINYPATKNGVIKARGVYYEDGNKFVSDDSIEIIEGQVDYNYTLNNLSALTTYDNIGIEFWQTGIDTGELIDTITIPGETTTLSNGISQDYEVSNSLVTTKTTDSATVSYDADLADQGYDETNITSITSNYGTVQYDNVNDPVVNGTNELTITDLDPKTPYGDLVLTFSNDITTKNLSVETFSTNSLGQDDIEVTNLTVDETTSSGATFNFDADLNPRSDTYDELTGVTVTTSDKYNEPGNPVVNGENSISVDGIAPNTTFNDFELVFRSSTNDIIEIVQVPSFSTNSLGYDEPVISGGDISAKTTSSVSVSFDIDLNPNFEYDLVDDLQASSSFGILEDNEIVNGYQEITISGLTPWTLYESETITFTSENADFVKVVTLPDFRTESLGYDDPSINIEEDSIIPTKDSVSMDINLDINPNSESGYEPYINTLTIESNYGVVDNPSLSNGTNNINISGLDPKKTYDDLELSIFTTNPLTGETTYLENSLMIVPEFTTTSLGSDSAIEIDNVNLSTLTEDSVNIIFDADLNPTEGYDPAQNVMITSDTYTLSESTIVDGQNIITISGLDPNKTYSDIMLDITIDGNETQTKITVPEFKTLPIDNDYLEVTNKEQSTPDKTSINIEFDVNNNPSGQEYTPVNLDNVELSTNQGTLSQNSVVNGTNTVIVSELTPNSIYDDVVITFTDIETNQTLYTLDIDEFVTDNNGQDEMTVDSNSVVIDNQTENSVDITFITNLNPDPTKLPVENVIVESNYGNIVYNFVTDGEQTITIDNLNPNTTYTDLNLTFKSEENELIQLEIPEFTTNSLGEENTIDVDLNGVNNITNSSVDVDLDVNLNPNLEYDPASDVTVSSNYGDIEINNITNGEQTITISNLDPYTNYDDLTLQFYNSENQLLNQVTIDSFKTESLGLDNSASFSETALVSSVTRDEVELTFNANLNPTPGYSEEIIESANTSTEGATVSFVEIVDGVNTVKINGLNPGQIYENETLTLVGESGSEYTLNIESFETEVNPIDTIEVTSEPQIIMDGDTVTNKDGSSITVEDGLTTNSVAFKMSTNLNPNMGNYTQQNNVVLTTNYGYLSDNTINGYDNELFVIEGLDPNTTYSDLTIGFEYNENATSSDLALPDDIVLEEFTTDSNIVIEPEVPVMNDKATITKTSASTITFEAYSDKYVENYQDVRLSAKVDGETEDLKIRFPEEVEMINGTYVYTYEVYKLDRTKTYTDFDLYIADNKVELTNDKGKEIESFNAGVMTFERIMPIWAWTLLGLAALTILLLPLAIYLAWRNKKRHEYRDELESKIILE